MPPILRHTALLAALVLVSPALMGPAAATDAPATDAASLDITGDAKAGKGVFKKCKACHTVKAGKNKSGPSLYGVVGAQAGKAPDFAYSAALQEARLVWDIETLSRFLSDPKALVPGNKMSFRGLDNQSDIADVIAYLHHESQD